MKAQYVEHQINEMDDSKVQRCVLCGYLVTDYRNTMWQTGQGEGSPHPPKGFAAGAVYIREGQPRITMTDKPAEGASPCTNPY